jgi:hypothetical protein
MKLEAARLTISNHFAACLRLGSSRFAACFQLFCRPPAPESSCFAACLCLSRPLAQVTLPHTTSSELRVWHAPSGFHYTTFKRPLIYEAKEWFTIKALTFSWVAYQIFKYRLMTVTITRKGTGRLYKVM